MASNPFLDVAEEIAATEGKRRPRSRREDYRARYFPLVQAAARKYNIPEEIFDRLITQESGYNPRALGPPTKSGRAKGIGQFIDSTARGFGIDPYNPEQAIDATGRYLRRNFDEFGNWSHAAAAYNAGEGAVRKYKGVPPYRETQNYVKRVVPREYQGETPQYRTVANEVPANPFADVATEIARIEGKPNPFADVARDMAPKEKSITPAPTGTLKPVGKAKDYQQPTPAPVPVSAPVELTQTPPAPVRPIPAPKVVAGEGYSLNPSEAALAQYRKRFEGDFAEAKRQVEERQRFRGPNTPDTRLDRLGQARRGRTAGEWAVDLATDIASFGTTGELRGAQDLIVQRALQAAREGNLPSPQFSSDKNEREKQQALLARKIGPRAKAYFSNVMRDWHLKRQADRVEVIPQKGPLGYVPLQASVAQYKYPNEARFREEAIRQWQAFPEALKAQLAKQGVSLGKFGEEVARVIAFEQAAKLIDQEKVNNAAQAAAYTNLAALLFPELKLAKPANVLVRGLEKKAAAEGLNIVLRKGAGFAAEALKPSQVAADAIIGEVGAGLRSATLGTPYRPGEGAATAVGTGALVRGALGTFGKRTAPVEPVPVEEPVPTTKRTVTARRVVGTPGSSAAPKRVVRGAVGAAAEALPEAPPMRRPGGPLREVPSEPTATEPVQVTPPREPLAERLDRAAGKTAAPNQPEIPERSPAVAEPIVAENPNLVAPEKLGITEPEPTVPVTAKPEAPAPAKPTLEELEAQRVAQFKNRDQARNAVKSSEFRPPVFEERPRTKKQPFQQPALDLPPETGDIGRGVRVEKPETHITHKGEGYPDIEHRHSVTMGGKEVGTLILHEVNENGKRTYYPEWRGEVTPEVEQMFKGSEWAKPLLTYHGKGMNLQRPWEGVPSTRKFTHGMYELDLEKDVDPERNPYLFDSRNDETAVWVSPDGRLVAADHDWKDRLSAVEYRSPAERRTAIANAEAARERLKNQPGLKGQVQWSIPDALKRLGHLRVLRILKGNKRVLAVDVPEGLTREQQDTIDFLNENFLPVIVNEPWTGSPFKNHKSASWENFAKRQNIARENATAYTERLRKSGEYGAQERFTEESPWNVNLRKKPLKAVYEALDAAEAKVQARREKRGKPTIGSLGAFGGKAASDLAEDIVDATAVGALKFARGVVKFAEWSAAMVEAFGKEVEPHLRTIWAKARDAYERDYKGPLGLEHTPEAPPKIVRKAKQLNPRGTGLANQVLKREFESGALKALPQSGRGWINERQALDQGAAAINAGRIKPQELADAVAAKPRPLTAEEVGALTVEAARLRQVSEDAGKQLDADPLNADLKAKYDAAQDAAAAFVDKVQLGKTQLSAAFNALKAGVNLDTGNFEDVIQAVRRERGVKTVAEVPEDVQKEFRNLTEAVQKVTKERDAAIEAQARLELEIAKAREGQLLPDDVPTRSRTPRSKSAARQERQQQLKTEFRQHLSDLDEILKEIKPGEGLFANPLGESGRVAYELIRQGGHRIAGNMAINLAEQLGLGFEEAIERTITALRSKGVDAKFEDVVADLNDLQATRGQQRQRVVSKAAKLKRDARTFANLTKRLEEAKAGQRPARRVTEKEEGRIAGLRQELRDTLKEQGISSRAMTDDELIAASEKRQAELEQQLRENDLHEPKRREVSERVRMARQREAQLRGMVRARLKEQKPQTGWQKLSTLQKQGLLSNPVSHLKNIVSTAGFAGVRHLERLLQAGIELPKAAMGKERSVTFTDVGKGVSALPRGLRAGLQAAIDTWKTGISPEAARAGELPHREVGGKALAAGSRGMAMADAFFKGVIYESSLAELASNKASKEGLKGKAHAARVTELLNDADLQAQATNQAKEYTFNEDPDEFSKGLNQWKRNVPALDLLLPFTSTPWNVAKSGIRYSPVGWLRLLSKDARGRVGSSKILAQGMLGTGMMIAIHQLLQNVEFYGAPPTDPNKKAEFFRSGKRANSIRIGKDKWLDFGGMGALTTQLALMADLKQNFWEKGKSTPVDAFNRLTLSLGRATIDGSVFNSLEAIARAFDSENAAQKFEARSITGMVPYSGLVRGIATATDPRKPIKDPVGAMTTPPAYRKARNLGEELMLGVPGLRQMVPRADTKAAEIKKRVQQRVGK